MSREQRFVNLYSTLGLNTENGTINRAEIKAYCAGMAVLDEIIRVVIDEQNVAKPVDLTWDELNDYLGDDPFDISVVDKFVAIVVANYEKIGVLVQNWFSPFCKVILYGDGLPWSRLDKTWSEIHRRAYRWSMINTMPNITEV